MWPPPLQGVQALPASTPTPCLSSAPARAPCGSNQRHPPGPPRVQPEDGPRKSFPTAPSRARLVRNRGKAQQAGGMGLPCGLRLLWGEETLAEAGVGWGSVVEGVGRAGGMPVGFRL